MNTENQALCTQFANAYIKHARKGLESACLAIKSDAQTVKNAFDSQEYKADCTYFSYALGKYSLREVAKSFDLQWFEMLVLYDKVGGNISDIMAKRGIDFICFKGSVFSHKAFKSYMGRTYEYIKEKSRSKNWTFAFAVRRCTPSEQRLAESLKLKKPKHINKQICSVYVEQNMPSKIYPDTTENLAY